MLVIQRLKKLEKLIGKRLYRITFKDGTIMCFNDVQLIEFSTNPKNKFDDIVKAEPIKEKGQRNFLDLCLSIMQI